MNANYAENFLLTHNKYFDSISFNYIKEVLSQTDESKLHRIKIENYNDPFMILIISILAGTLGLDRIIIGDIGIGVLKLITCGGFGMWYFIDLFLIMRATREKNLQKLLQLANY